MPMPPPSSVKPVVFKTAQDILDWQPTDVSPLMISSVPVASRPVSSNQRFLVGLDNGEWSYWSHFDRSPQGGCRSNVYNFQFWQYVDEMYYYMHNLAAVPPVVWTNAAHRNGVRMFAAVTADFTNGGTEFNKLFQDPVKAAEQLFKIVNTYRFDGWMFDVENGAIASPNLLRAMQLLRAQRLWNNAPVAVGYYEAGGFSIDQYNLPFFKAGSFFQSDYTSDPDTTAPQDTYDVLGQNGLAGARYDTYWSVFPNQFSSDTPVEGGLYNGCVYLDVKGFFRQLAKAKMAPPSTDYYQSIAIYAPDWTMYGGIHETRTPIPERDVFLRTERLLWSGTAIGADGKPVTSSPCVADFIPPRTTLVAPPFVTRFNTGQGWCFVVEGVRYTISDWNYLSGQDLLPTSLAPTGAPPPSVVADYAYDDPYDGGSALALSGTVPWGQSVEFPLFAAKMSLPPGYQAQFTYKVRTAGTVLPQMTIVYSNQTSVVVRPTTTSGWTRVTQPLPPTPTNVYIIGIRIDFQNSSSFPASVDTLIGELGIVSSSSVRPPSMPPITPTDDLLTWNPPAGVSVWYYNVFGMTVDGPALMGRTILPRYDLTMALFPNVEVGDQYLIQTVNTMGQASTLQSV